MASYISNKKTNKKRPYMHTPFLFIIYLFILSWIKTTITAKTHVLDQDVARFLDPPQSKA